MISDVDENEPVPLWRNLSNESSEAEAPPLLYSIQVNLKVYTLDFPSFHKVHVLYVVIQGLYSENGEE